MNSAVETLGEPLVPLTPRQAALQHAMRPAFEAILQLVLLMNSTPPDNKVAEAIHYLESRPLVEVMSFWTRELAAMTFNSARDHHLAMSSLHLLHPYAERLEGLLWGMFRLTSTYAPPLHSPLGLSCRCPDAQRRAGGCLHFSRWSLLRIMIGAAQRALRATLTPLKEAADEHRRLEHHVSCTEPSGPLSLRRIDLQGLDDEMCLPRWGQHAVMPPTWQTLDLCRPQKVLESFPEYPRV